MALASAYMWEFHIRKEFRAEFERIYGPDGEWVALFKCSKGYIGTQLHHDINNSERYFTVDLWESKDEYDAFRRERAPEFDLLDKKCNLMTDEEVFIGEFHCWH